MQLIQERPYQTACIEAMFTSMHEGKEFGLIDLPTGSGKTIIISRFLEDVYGRYGGKRDRIRTCVVAHREKLVSQAYEKLLKVWPESAPKIGIACASISNDVNIDSEIILCSIQTLMRRLLNRTIEPFDIIIVDEAHRIPYKEKNSLYKRLIEYTKEIQPRRKIFGLSATTYQLGHGYIFGDHCKEGHHNWFPEVTYAVSMDSLIEQGYLVPYRIRQAIDIGPELRSVPILNGEFKNDVLGQIMCKFSTACVNAYAEYGENRKSVVVFCVNIEHAEQVATTFRMAGIPSCAVHSKLADKERARRLAAFSKGEVNVLTSVDALSEGWDETAIDCIIMLRPTKSPMVYVQQAGRGLRPHPGKKDLLVLDMADNVRTHGFFSQPEVVIPGNKPGGDPPVKICPGENGKPCGRALHASIMVCPDCGHVFVPKTYKEPEHVTMEEVKPKARYTLKNPARVRIFPPHFEAGESSLKLSFFFTDPNTGRDRRLHYFLGYRKIEHPDFAFEWCALTGLAEIPKSRGEMEALLHKVKWPKIGYVHKENAGRFPTLCGWEHDGEIERFPDVRYHERKEMPAIAVAGQVRPTRKSGAQKLLAKHERPKPKGTRNNEPEIAAPRPLPASSSAIPSATSSAPPKEPLVTMKTLLRQPRKRLGAKGAAEMPPEAPSSTPPASAMPETSPGVPTPETPEIPQTPKASTPSTSETKRTFFTPKTTPVRRRPRI